MNLSRRIVLAFVLLLGTTATSAEVAVAAQPSLTVFAAASLKESLDQIGAAWTAKTGQKVAISFAGSSALAKQIEQGAPADVFISADTEWMDYLSARDLIDGNSRFDVAGNSLVVIVPRDSALQTLELTVLAVETALGQGRLAVAEVTSVPAGRYAQESLKHLNLWEGVVKRLAQAENVRAAMAFVALGETPLGIVYATDAKAESSVRVVAALPADTHSAIAYPAAKIARSTTAGAAPFLEFLKAPEAHGILKVAGFSFP